MAFLKKLQTKLTALGVAVALLFALEGPPLQAQGNREYALKAAFLYNFCRFIDWPNEAFASGTSPIVIGVLGADPFGTLLTDTMHGELVHGRPIKVERYGRAEEARNAHILFVSDSETSRLPAVLAALRGRSVVTVGETESFIGMGGMIALIAEQNRVRLRINPATVRAANISMSSKLLRVADTHR